MTVLSAVAGAATLAGANGSIKRVEFQEDARAGVTATRHDKTHQEGRAMTPERADELVLALALREGERACVIDDPRGKDEIGKLIVIDSACEFCGLPPEHLEDECLAEQERLLAAFAQS